MKIRETIGNQMKETMVQLGLVAQVRSCYRCYQRYQRQSSPKKEAATEPRLQQRKQAKKADNKQLYQSVFSDYQKIFATFQKVVR